MKFATSWHSRAALLGVLAAATLLATGCDRQRRPAVKRPSAGGAQQGSSALLDSIRTRLRTLPELSQLNLTPPTVVIDARSSTDGEDIEAVVSRRPGALPGEPANLITVPRGNVHFRGEVRPGDTVKYYGLLDRDTQARVEAGTDVDIFTFDAIDLTVAQVLSDNSLLTEQGLITERDDFRKIEIWRTVDVRMDEIQREWSAYVARREPPLAWHPSPDEAAIDKLTDLLNQWLRQSRVAGKRADKSGWERPELLATLLEPLASSDDLKPYLADDDLALGYFRRYETRAIEGAIWRRDVSRWARGGDASPMGIARSLFDWTVRNVQLVEASQTPPRWPWEAMLYGQATAEGRAWVFAGLCEQQDLTAAVVTIPGGEGAAARPLVGVLDGDQLRLFDPALGLPLPGERDGEIATLAAIRADDALLRKLDLEGDPYPVTAEQAGEARVGVVAAPLALTRRAAALSARLTAEDALVLSVDVDASAERLRGAEGIDEVSLWAGPFQLLVDKLNAKPSQRRQAVKEFLPFAWRPVLWRARTQHFRGVKEEADAKRDVLDETLDDHQAALRHYMNRNVRPHTDRLADVAEEKRDIYLSAKTLATLYLGLLKHDQGEHEVAKGWLENGALEGSEAESLRPAVLYNLARAYEELGETEKAVELLESIEGPMAPGAKLRARSLPDPDTDASEP